MSEGVYTESVERESPKEMQSLRQNKWIVYGLTESNAMKNDNIR